MGKNTTNCGNSVFGQLIKFIDRKDIQSCVEKHKSDRYCKRFTTFEHLISMLYCVTAPCYSLRAVCSGMQGFKEKLKHLGIKSKIAKSTLGDANKRRDAEVFGSMYSKLIQQYKEVLSDSKLKIHNYNVKIIDSTTISLFKDILKATGRIPKDGKHKGGIKAHTMMEAGIPLPQFVKYTSAATNDIEGAKAFTFTQGDLVIYDKGYNDYETFERYTLEGIKFVTRLKENAKYNSVEEIELSDKTSDAVMKEEIIELEVKHHDRKPTKLKLRLIHFWDAKHACYYKFVTNLLEVKTDTVTGLYKQRWQIETLFKRLKQNFQIQYFVGDNINAIQIQIWCALIANLIFTIISKQLKRKWDYSNIVSLCRLHLSNYFDIFGHLEKPDASIHFYDPVPIVQTLLFK
jgi:Transposase DDE domain/Domain of unknown function (DUF4372)